MMPNALFGSALALAGVFCLFGSWKDWLAARLRPVAIGWALLAVSLYFWSQASGAEFGITVALIVPGVIAWACVTYNAELRQQRNRTRNAKQQDPDQLPPAAARSWPRHVLLFAITVPVAAIASLMVSIAVSMLMPWTDLSEMLLATILLPIVWGCAAYWAVADGKLLRPASCILVGGAVAAVFVLT